MIIPGIFHKLIAALSPSQPVFTGKSTAVIIMILLPTLLPAQIELEVIKDPPGIFPEEVLYMNRKTPQTLLDIQLDSRGFLWIATKLWAEPVRWLRVPDIFKR